FVIVDGYIICLVLWGLDSNGFFIGKNESTSHLNWFQRTFLHSKADVDVSLALLADLQQVHRVTEKEVEGLEVVEKSKVDVGKRLLYLFQLDLLPGVSGLILESKANRESTGSHRVSQRTKNRAW